MPFELGLDGSFTNSKIVPVDWFERRVAEGYRVWVQCAWTGGYAGNDGINAVCEGNLLNALAGGLKIMAYVNATPQDWWPIATQMAEIKKNCGSAWDLLEVLPVDVEIKGVDLWRATEMANALRAAGKNQKIEILYSARWFWNGYIDNQQDGAWLRWVIWNAHYDFNPDIDFEESPWGPWTIKDLIGEQFQGTTRLEDIDVDLNAFNLSAIFPVGEVEPRADPGPKPTPPPPPPPPPPVPKDHYKVVGGDIAGLIAERFGLTMKQLAALNPGKPASGDWGLIQPGEVFKIAPKPAPKPRKRPKLKPKAPPAESYTVVGGDTAGAIAHRFGLTIYFEKGWKGTFVALNPGQPRSGDWNRIHAGEVFRVKGAPARPPKPASKSKQKTYKVKSGDALGAISTKYTGHAGRWVEIPNIPDHVRKNPRLLQVGFVLHIPW